MIATSQRVLLSDEPIARYNQCAVIACQAPQWLPGSGRVDVAIQTSSDGSEDIISFQWMVDFNRPLAYVSFVRAKVGDADRICPESIAECLEFNAETNFYAFLCEVVQVQCLKGIVIPAHGFLTTDEAVFDIVNHTYFGESRVYITLSEFLSHPLPTASLIRKLIAADLALVDNKLAEAEGKSKRKRLVETLAPTRKIGL